MDRSPGPAGKGDPTQVIRRDWAGEPNVLFGENAENYNELLTQVSRVIAPRDVLEEMWMRDLVDLAWDVLRLRRLKADLLKMRARGAVREVISPLVQGHWKLAEKWSAGDAAAVEEVEAVLKAAGLSMDTVMATALADAIDGIERIEGLIASAENRRGVALAEIERYRAEFARQLREVISSPNAASPGILPQPSAENGP